MIYGGKHKQTSRFGSRIVTITLVLGLCVLFVVLLFWFRRPQPVNQDGIDSIAQILTPDPISQFLVNGAIDTISKTAQLFLVADWTGLGQAERGRKDDRPFFQIKAELPEIDRALFFYEGWLVRPLPYAYFSMGEMMTNEDGLFVLEWEGQKDQDISDYVQVVITRQEYGGSPDPQVHIVEGMFGK